MSLGVAILCGIIYWLAEANLPFVGLWTLQRPLVCGFLTGCLLGQPVTGAVVGATINLVWPIGTREWRKMQNEKSIVHCRIRL